MGNSPSRYDETDWDAANGGLTDATQTVDGTPPGTSHRQLTMHPTQKVPILTHNLPVLGKLVSTREYQVKDAATDHTIYTTAKVPELCQGFDVIAAEGNKILLRVEATFNNRTWHIYQIGTAVFEGQRADPVASKKCGQNLFRKAAVKFGKSVEHAAVVYMFRNHSTDDEADDDDDDDDDVDTVLRVERCRGDTLHWHFQTMLPNDNNNNNDQEAAPLVGYWKWEGSVLPTGFNEKIVMDLAAGTDCALHVVLAVLATLERSSSRAEYSG